MPYHVKDLALTPIRLAVLAVTLGGATATLLWVATYRVSVAAPISGTVQSWGIKTIYASPAWTTPVAAVIAIAAAGAAALILHRR